MSTDSGTAALRDIFGDVPTEDHRELYGGDDHAATPAQLAEGVTADDRNEKEVDTLGLADGGDAT